MSATRPSSRSGPPSAGPAPGPTGLTRWAVRLAVVVAAVLAVVYSIFGLTWAFGGEDAISDTFVGYLAGYSLVGGMAVALVAFVMAVVARAKHQRAALLWLPTALFPALIVILTLAEIVWME